MIQEKLPDIKSPTCFVCLVPVLNKQLQGKGAVQYISRRKYRQSMVNGRRKERKRERNGQAHCLKKRNKKEDDKSRAYFFFFSEFIYFYLFYLFLFVFICSHVAILAYVL